MSQAAVAIAPVVSLHEVAQRVYVVYRDVTDTAVADLLRRFSENDQLDELQEWAVRELLNKARLQTNHGTYTQAHGLRARLSVEDPPAGYRDPTGRGEASTPVVFVKRPALGDGKGLKVPLAAFRVLLKLQLRLGAGKAIMVDAMKKPDVLRAALQLETQGRGCLENAGLLRTLAGEMLDGECAKQTVRRLERA